MVATHSHGMPRWEDPVPALKRHLADEILILMDGWSQHFAASFMQVSQSCVSDLRRGHLERISLERLVKCLSHLGREIEITTTRGRGGFAHPHWLIDGRVPRAGSDVVPGKRVSRTG
jgi:predicted XRE-type DNA-binding protein